MAKAVGVPVAKRQRRFAKVFGEPKHVTQQQFKRECDVNEIVKRAQRGIAPAFLNNREARYGDFSNVPSLAEAHSLVAAARDAFMELPAALRRELDNDPRNLSQLTQEQAERYKLLKERPEASPQDDQGSGGGRPPEKEPKAPKAKSEAPAKEAKSVPASKQDGQE